MNLIDAFLKLGYFVYMEELTSEYSTEEWKGQTFSTKLLTNQLVASNEQESRKNSGEKRKEHSKKLVILSDEQFVFRRPPTIDH